MKKFISVMLVLIMLFSFASCKEKYNGPSELQETLPIDVETLKTDWTKGELVIKDKTVKIPCTVNSFIEQSGLKVGNESGLGDKIVEPGKSLTINIVGEGISLKVKVLNTGKEDVVYKEALIVKYDYNNTNEGNKQIKFAGTLSPGAARSAVEEALGIPAGQTSADTLYRYKSKNASGKNVELIVSFNSYNVANSVSFEIKY